MIYENEKNKNQQNFITLHKAHRDSVVWPKCESSFSAVLKLKLYIYTYIYSRKNVTFI